MRLLSAILSRLALGLLLLGSVGMIVSMLLGVADVVGTSFLGTPVPGTLETSIPCSESSTGMLVATRSPAASIAAMFATIVTRPCRSAGIAGIAISKRPFGPACTEDARCSVPS